MALMQSDSDLVGALWQRVDDVEKRYRSLLGRFEQRGDIISTLRAEILDLRERLDAARIDPVTGLLNLTGLTNGHGMDRRSYNGRVCNAVMDISNFKRVNDTWGHAKGNDVLLQLAKIIESEVRSSDVAWRMGGDEFCILMKDCSYWNANSVLHRIKRRFDEYATLNFNGDAQPEQHVFLSYGISCSQLGWRENLTERADRSMYQKKREEKKNKREK